MNDDSTVPPGAQAERTALSWQRTGLAMTAAGAVLVHVHLISGVLPVWPGLLMMAAGVLAAAVVAPVRYALVRLAIDAGRTPRSTVAMLLPVAVVAAAVVATASTLAWT
jgi:uncharacterized membrane protein YidH (DUF202 family)